MTFTRNKYQTILLYYASQSKKPKKNHEIKKALTANPTTKLGSLKMVLAIATKNPIVSRPMGEREMGIVLGLWHALFEAFF